MTLWQQDRRADSIDELRHAIVTYGNDDQTWYLYASRLRSVGRRDAAFEAVKMALDLQPLNFKAQELLLELSHGRAETSGYETRAMDKLAQEIQSRPDLHRTAIGYFIPARCDAGIEALKLSPDPVVRQAVELNESMADTAQWQQVLDRYPADQAAAAQLLYFLAHGRPTDACHIMESIKTEEIPAGNVRLAIRWALWQSDGAAAEHLLRQYLRVHPDDPWATSRLRTLPSGPRVSLALARTGYPLPSPRASAEYPAVMDRVLYLLHNSLPYDSGGYATRTHGILRQLRESGWNVTGLTRLGYPWDRPGRRDIPEIPPVDIVDGVPYERSSRRPSRELKNPIESYVDRYSRVLIRKAREDRPFALHAASNHWNGLAAVTAARMLGIPSVYEVRGLWEVTRASREPHYADSELYRYTARMERDAAEGATAVIAITNALKTELVARGVSESKITVVPNGVNTTRFTPRSRNDALAAELGVAGKTVIGYVGSVVDYEGIDLLIAAAAKIAQDREDFVVLIVGDGADLERVRALAGDHGLGDQIIFTGRVPHEEVEDYYSIIDIAPFPRLPLPVCEMVSPLKPLEAMAMGKVVIASDVAALAEMLDDGVTGIVHRKGDVASLVDGLTRLLDDAPLRDTLSEAARHWAVQERDWQKLARMISDVYENLGGVVSAAARSWGGAVARS